VRVVLAMGHRRLRGATTRHTPELEAAIYRIVQEAITNIHKHAQASTVIIAIGETTDTVELSVEDDGCGFDHSATTKASFGLIGMRERVSLLDGTLTLASEPGHGTKLAATIPSRRREPDTTASPDAEAPTGSVQTASGG
jgi:signal transduction histidine kinase